MGIGVTVKSQRVHGDMVACDNKECDIKWYHISCVGMTGAKVTAKKWLCPIFHQSKKLRK